MPLLKLQWQHPFERGWKQRYFGFFGIYRFPAYMLLDFIFTMLIGIVLGVNPDGGVSMCYIEAGVVTAVTCMLALLAGAIGVAVALRVMGTTRPAYLIALGGGFWLVNVSNVLLGTQSFTDWLDSSVFIATTLIAGRLLLGTGLDPSPSHLDGSTQLDSPLRSHTAR